jgi:hypothetical protein
MSYESVLSLCIRKLTTGARLREKISWPCSAVITLAHFVLNGNIFRRRRLQPQYLLYGRDLPFFTIEIDDSGRLYRVAW